MSEAILIYKKTFSGNSFVVLGDATADDFLNWDGEHPCKLNSRIFSALDNVKLDAFVTDLNSATIADWDQENWFHCIFHSYFWYGYKLTGTLYEEDSTTVLGLGSAGLAGSWYPFNFSFVSEDLTYGNDDPTLDGTYGYFKIVDITYRGPLATDGGLTGKWEIKGTLALSETGTGDPAKYIYFHDVMDFNNITGANYKHTEYYYTSGEGDGEEPYVGHEVVGNYHHFGQKDVVANASLYFLGNASTQYAKGQTGNIWITGKAKTTGKIQVLSGIPANPRQSYDVTAGEEFKFCYGPISELNIGEPWLLKTTTGTTLDYIEVLASKFDPPAVPDIVPESFALAGSGQNSCVKSLSTSLGNLSYHSRIDLSHKQSSGEYDIPADATNVRTVIWFHNSEALTTEYNFYLYYEGPGFMPKQTPSSYTIPVTRGWHRICVEDFLPEGLSGKNVQLYAMSEVTGTSSKFDMIISSVSWTPAAGGGDVERFVGYEKVGNFHHYGKEATTANENLLVTGGTSSTLNYLANRTGNIIVMGSTPTDPPAEGYIADFYISPSSGSGTRFAQQTITTKDFKISAALPEPSSSAQRVYVSIRAACEYVEVFTSEVEAAGHFVGHEVVDDTAGDVHHSGAVNTTSNGSLWLFGTSSTDSLLPTGKKAIIIVRGETKSGSSTSIKLYRGTGVASTTDTGSGSFQLEIPCAAPSSDIKCRLAPVGQMKWIEAYTILIPES